MDFHQGKRRALIALLGSAVAANIGLVLRSVEARTEGPAC
jgi:hypothetical protein